MLILHVQLFCNLIISLYLLNGMNRFVSPQNLRCWKSFFKSCVVIVSHFVCNYRRNIVYFVDYFIISLCMYEPEVRVSSKWPASCGSDIHIPATKTLKHPGWCGSIVTLVGLQTEIKLIKQCIILETYHRTEGYFAGNLNNCLSQIKVNINI